MATVKKTPPKQPKEAPIRVSDTPETDPFLVRALSRGLAILRLIDVDHREWTIDEMAEQTGLLRMTVYRMVRTLESTDFLVRDPATNRYRLGPAILAMTHVSTDHSELVNIARPFLEKLVRESGESVTLAVEIDGLPVCVDMINTTRPFKRRTAPGRIIGDLASVQGKVFAAFKSEEEREAILAVPQKKLTPNTITDPEELRAQLDHIRETDVAYDMEGLYFSTCGVGSPIRDQLGDVIATVAVVAPTGRFGLEERERCTKAVQSAAAALSAYLGWNQGTGATA
jgi:DNA-binding IclR family transcriptional regulator